MENSDYGARMNDNDKYNRFLEDACELVSSLNRAKVNIADDDGMKIDDADLLKAYIQFPDAAVYAEEQVRKFKNRYFVDVIAEEKKES